MLSSWSFVLCTWSFVGLGIALLGWGRRSRKKSVPTPVESLGKLEKSKIVLTETCLVHEASPQGNRPAVLRLVSNGSSLLQAT